MEEGMPQITPTQQAPVYNQQTQQPSSDGAHKTLTIVSIAILVLTLINTYGIFFSGGSVTGSVVEEGTQNAPTINAPAPERVEVNIEGAPVKGDKDAPVTIVEFSDYECPFCGRHYQETYPQIVSQYINSGKAKLVFKDFPLSFHPQAQKAAETARCFGEQKGNDGYWKMHDKLFENQQGLGIENFKKWAKELGADGAKFDSCLASGKYSAAVQKDQSDGAKAGVQGTPAFLINGKAITGAQPFEAFRQAIEEELS